MLRVALLLAAAATACGKDTDGECRNFAHCGLTKLEGALDAFNTQNANKAQETLSDVVGEAAGGIVVDAIRNQMPDPPSTTTVEPSTITCKPSGKKGSKVYPCKEGDIVVDTGNGGLCSFIKYIKKDSWAECRNTHGVVGSYRPGALRHATEGDKSVHKKAVDAYQSYKENGGEEPPLPKVAKFADEGSPPDPKEVENLNVQMKTIVTHVGYEPDGQGRLGDLLSTMLVFDKMLSTAEDGRGRKLSHHLLRGPSVAKQIERRDAAVAMLKEWEKVPGDKKTKNFFMSDAERRRRAEAEAKEELDQLELEDEKKTQIKLDTHSVDENGELVERTSGRHEITGEPSYPRVSPNVFLDSTKDSDVYLTEALLKCVGGRAGTLEKAQKLLDFYFSFDQLQARADLQYLDSNKGTGLGDQGRLGRIGTNGDYKSRDITQIGANIAVEVYEEYGRFDPPILESDEPHVVAKKIVSTGFLGLRDVGMVKWDEQKKTWFNGGDIFTCMSAANHRRADGFQAKADAIVAPDAVSGPVKGGYKRQADRWRSPDAIPSDGAVLLFFLVKYLQFGGEMNENVYCLYGVDATTHAASGKSVRDFVMSQKKENIKWRNDLFEECKKSGKCVVHFQFRGPHGSQESADEFYTEIYKVRLDEWVFGGETGARRILEGEHLGLKHVFEAAASTVPGPTGGRVNVNNVRHFLSLDESTTSVYCGTDYRLSNDNMESWHGMFPGPWPENAGKMLVRSYV